MEKEKNIIEQLSLEQPQAEMVEETLKTQDDQMIEATKQEESMGEEKTQSRMEELREKISGGMPEEAVEILRAEVDLIEEEENLWQDTLNELRINEFLVGEELSPEFVAQWGRETSKIYDEKQAIKKAIEKMQEMQTPEEVGKYFETIDNLVDEESTLLVNHSQEELKTNPKLKMAAVVLSLSTLTACAGINIERDFKLTFDTKQLSNQLTRAMTSAGERVVDTHYRGLNMDLETQKQLNRYKLQFNQLQRKKLYYEQQLAQPGITESRRIMYEARVVQVEEQILTLEGQVEVFIANKELDKQKMWNDWKSRSLQDIIRAGGYSLKY